jgi:hypothetical protein
MEEIELDSFFPLDLSLTSHRHIIYQFSIDPLKYSDFLPQYLYFKEFPTEILCNCCLRLLRLNFRFPFFVPQHLGFKF